MKVRVGSPCQGHYQVGSSHKHSQGVFWGAYQMCLTTHLWDRRLLCPTSLGWPHKNQLPVLLGCASNRAEIWVPCRVRRAREESRSPCDTQMQDTIKSHLWEIAWSPCGLDVVPKKCPVWCSVNSSEVQPLTAFLRTLRPWDVNWVASGHKACWWQRELEPALLIPFHWGFQPHCTASTPHFAVVRKHESKVPCSCTHKVWEEVQKKCLASIMVITTEKLMQDRTGSIINGCYSECHWN